jgi:hypothetical protein
MYRVEVNPVPFRILHIEPQRVALAEYRGKEGDFMRFEELEIKAPLNLDREAVRRLVPFVRRSPFECSAILFHKPVEDVPQPVGIITANV